MATATMTSNTGNDALYKQKEENGWVRLHQSVEPAITNDVSSTTAARKHYWPTCKPSRHIQPPKCCITSTPTHRRDHI